MPDSPAAEAGLQGGDIIHKFNGKKMDSATELRHSVASTSPGQTTSMRVFRDGDWLNLDVTVGTLDDSKLAYGGTSSTGLNDFGISVRGLDPAPFNESSWNGKFIGVSRRLKNLDVLANLPALTDLQLLADPARAEDLEFISRCKNLKSLSVNGGMSDDTTAKAIGESPTLERATLGQDCFMTDEGVEWLAKNRKLTSLSIGGEITADAVLKLRELPVLSYLSVSSDAILKDERKILNRKLHGVRSDFRSFSPSSGKRVVGADGIWRMSMDREDIDFDELEGKAARELVGGEFFDQIQAIMEDKVVLVEFWGTWCGPCLMLKPQIEDLADRYKKDGLEVISIHSQRGVETLDEYINEHPFQWANLVDRENQLAQSFGVRLYPSLYLFDRQGKLRVARAHKLKIGDAVDRLLNE